jgi:hypothetical protein
MKAWRCYTQSSLDSDGRFIGGTEYCTRHKQLSELLRECRELELSPEPSKPQPSSTPLQKVEVSALGASSSSSRSRSTQVLDADGAPTFGVGGTPTLETWSADREVTVHAVDTGGWEATPEKELLRVKAWRVDCLDDPSKHTLRNRTGNVSRKKAFLSRKGLVCHGPDKCVRGVVDGFASHDEIRQMLQYPGLVPQPTSATGLSNIRSWRWEVDKQPAVFRTLIARAQAVLEEQYGVTSLRFYRSNIITVDNPQNKLANRPMDPMPKPREWAPKSLHGDTNTDEMFLFTTILYLAQHGVEVCGGT